MTDTPDALILRFEDEARYYALAHPGSYDTHDYDQAKDALRARLTAGDAAIKRVADAERAEAALAAARAEIEQLTTPDMVWDDDLSRAGIAPRSAR